MAMAESAMNQVLNARMCNSQQMRWTPRGVHLLTQAIAKVQGMDPMGWAFPPMGYAAGQVLAQAVEATRSLDHVVLANYIRSHAFSTVVGDITFGKDGEWAKSRVAFTQFQNVTGNSLDQFKDTTHEVVVWPKAYKSGDLIYPYAKARKP